jgi:hypothetical protein
MKYFKRNKDCEICKGYCPRDSKEELSYFDCWNYIRIQESKLGKRKEPIVEIWVKEKKEWVEKNQSLL